ncbi:nicalin-1-like [Panonychus citri]|uniref:nicalin-1-like n=1 Tax=Panonychus citri TaxID=50023 RepID=UPI0023076822|nr:nicalin-1-like [Panonychus citri]
MFSFGENVFGELFRSSSSTASSACVSFQAICAMLTLIPILIVFSSGPKVVLANQELTVYRMKHHDWLGNPYGSRASVMNLEMRTISTLSQSYAKKCLLIRISEIIKSSETFEDLLKNPMVGGMLILVPNNLTNLGSKVRSSILAFEKTLASRTFDIPIYFGKENSNLMDIYQELSLKSDNVNDEHQGKKKFFGVDFFNAVLANGYQLSISGPSPKPITDPIITNIESKLTGSKSDDQSPTIVIAAHYDASGIASGLSYGGDSNGSGVVALLELIRLFSKLYNNRKSQPAVNLVFLLSGGGKFGFLGTKKWIEDHLDVKESGLLSDAQLSICLDSLGSSTTSSKSLFLHLPRIPKETSITHRLYHQLNEIATSKGADVSFVPEKTYLSDESLNWEHDRFIQRRLPSLTLSTLQNSKTLSRTSILDTYESVDIDTLSTNIEIIGETLSRLVFNIRNHSSSSIFKDELGVSKQFISSMLKQITSTSRSQQNLLTSLTGSTYKVSPLISTLFMAMKRFSKDTRYQHFRMDRKEPEIVFYEPTQLATNIYNIKPAIFDLFLSLGIVSYLLILYLFLTNFETIQMIIKSIKCSAIKSTENGTLLTKSKSQ